MKKLIIWLSALLSSALLFSGTALSSFASDGEPAAEPSIWQKIGDNIWYILLVVAFGAGLIIITRWQAKIKARDEKFKKEYDEWKVEHPEEAEMLETGSEIVDTPVNGVENETNNTDPQTAETNNMEETPDPEQ